MKSIRRFWSKKESLYREVRNMPPPLEVGMGLPVLEPTIKDLLDALPGQITTVPTHDPYEWFTPKR